MQEVARYRVVFADCDPMRIVYYGNYYRIFEIGRAELFRALGHPFPRYIEQGLYLGVIESSCRYLKPARYDDELRVFAAIGEVGRARLRIDYQVTAIDGSVLATGSTTHAVLDENGRPVRIPEEFKRVARECMTQSTATE